nr:hypothetical protein [Tanacetum cinerariifolium]
MCERCGVDLRNGICLLCHLSTSWADDHNLNSFDCPPDSYHPPHPTYKTYSGDSCGNDSQSGYDCPPQFPLNYEPEPGYTQNYNSCPHDSPSFLQQYPCCFYCRVTHKPYQCQPKNHDYYDEQNSCYDSNSFGFDQIQTPQYTINHQIFNAHNDLLDSQNKLMEQMTSMVKWLIPAYYDDDDDYNFVITPNEPVESLIIGDEHLDTISATESDEFIESCVENLVPNPNHIEDFSKSNKEFFSIDGDSFSIDDIDYVEASPPDLELVSSETNTFDNSLPEFETFYFDVEEISSGSITTPPDISLLGYEVFHDDHVKEISSGSPTTHSDSSLYASFMSDSYEFTDELSPFISAPEYDCFLFKVKPNSRDFTNDVVENISPMKEPQVLTDLPTHPTLQLNVKFQPSSEFLFTYVVWIFLPFLVYSVVLCYLLSLRNEDIIFDPGICKSTFSRPDISHRCGTVKKFNTHRSHLNKCPMLIHGQNNPPLDVLLFHFYPL